MSSKSPTTGNPLRREIRLIPGPARRRALTSAARGNPAQSGPRQTASGASTAQGNPALSGPCQMASVFFVGGTRNSRPQSKAVLE